MKQIPFLTCFLKIGPKTELSFQAIVSTEDLSRCMKGEYLRSRIKGV